MIKRVGWWSFNFFFIQPCMQHSIYLDCLLNSQLGYFPLEMRSQPWNSRNLGWDPTSQLGSQESFTPWVGSQLGFPGNLRLGSQLRSRVIPGGIYKIPSWESQESFPPCVGSQVWIPAVSQLRSRMGSRMYFLWGTDGQVKSYILHLLFFQLEKWGLFLTQVAGCFETHTHRKSPSKSLEVAGRFFTLRQPHVKTMT